MKRTLWFAAIALFVAVVWAASLNAAAAPSNPFASAARTRFTLRGHVDERLPVGSYVYLRVRDAAGASHWVATLAAFASSADEVVVTVLARSPSFVSPRLHRTFTPLCFGTVATAPFLTATDHSNKETL